MPGPIPPAAQSAHDRAVDAGDSGYVDPDTGLFVFTAIHLATRPCCGNGCRHCPYDDTGRSGLGGTDPRA